MPVDQVCEEEVEGVTHGVQGKRAPVLARTVPWGKGSCEFQHSK